MALPTKHVLGILVDNLLKRGSVLKLSPRTTVRWAQGLDIPRGGKTVIYTGHMYQLIPAISALASKMAHPDTSRINNNPTSITMRVLDITLFFISINSSFFYNEYTIAEMGP